MIKDYYNQDSAIGLSSNTTYTIRTADELSRYLYSANQPAYQGLENVTLRLFNDIYFNNKIEPCVIKPYSGNDYLYLVVPLRINA